MPTKDEEGLFKFIFTEFMKFFMELSISHEIHQFCIHSLMIGKLFHKLFHKLSHEFIWDVSHVFPLFVLFPPSSP